MKMIMMLITLGSLMGCASLKDKVYKDIHVGDSKPLVEDVLGHPHSIGPSKSLAGAEKWGYVDSNGKTCAILFYGDAVAKTICDENKSSSIFAPIGRVLSNFGNNMRNGAIQSERNNQPIERDCTSTNYGYSTHVSCR